MSITLELEPEIEEAIRADAARQGKEPASIVSDALKAKYATAPNSSEGEETLADLVAKALGPVWEAQKGKLGVSRLSEVEAACAPFPGE